MAAISTTDEIVANADYHSRLFGLFSELEYAPSALKQHGSYVKDLETQLAESNKRIEELAKSTTKERKEHERLRDSTTRRFAAKLSGKLVKFEANQEKEEKEYVAALQKEMVERESNAMIQQLLAEARAAREDLTEKTKKYESLQTEVDSLYSRIFDGPSESFPEEDRLEYDVHEAHKRHEEAQSQLNTESQAAELLARAVVQMDRCYAKVKEALEYSSMDIWSSGRGPSFADLFERDALTNATAHANQVQALVDQARRINPVVQPVGRVNIASGSYMTDVFMDNIFTDLAFHDKIKTCATQVLLANNRLKQERDAALERAEIAGQMLIRHSQQLDDRRKELYYLRKALFESVASHAPRPPSYDNATAVPPALPPKDPPPAFESDEQLPKDFKNNSFPSPRIALTAGPSVSFGGTAPRTNDNADFDPSTNPHSATQSTSPRPWGNRNPYAALLTQRTRSMSQSP